MRVTHVADDWEDTNFAGSELLRSLVQSGAVSPGNDEIAAFGGEHMSDGQSNALIGAGDEGKFAAEVVPCVCSWGSDGAELRSAGQPRAAVPTWALQGSGVSVDARQTSSDPVCAIADQREEFRSGLLLFAETA